MTSAQAKYFDGVTPVARLAVVTWTDRGLEIQFQEKETRLEVAFELWLTNEIKCEFEPHLVHVENQRKPNVFLEITNPKLIALLRDAFEPLGFFRHHQRVLALILFSIVVLIGVVSFWGADWVSRYVAMRVPFEMERRWSEDIEKSVQQISCETSTENAVLVKLAKRLDSSSQKQLSFNVHLVASKEVNAFALPGGTILVYQGLLHKARSAEEVAGVLAHEMEHVSRRHVLAGFIRSSLLSALWTLSAGDLSGLLLFDPSTVFKIASLKFSRRAEQEADEGAIRRLHEARISVNGLIHFFKQTLKGSIGERIPTILSTHPSNQFRERLVESQANPLDSQPALSKEDWEVLRKACQTRLKN